MYVNLVSLATSTYIWTFMQSPLNLNEQQIWGGNQFSPWIDDDNHDRIEEATLIGQGQNAPHFHKPSQGQFIASTLLDLFCPDTGDPSMYTFHLPNVPIILIHVTMHIIDEITVFFLHLLLLIIILSSLFLPCLPMMYRFPLHLYLIIWLLIGWVHHHQSSLSFCSESACF